MIDSMTGELHTYHTTNLVPFVASTKTATCSSSSGGALRDIAPTLLGVLKAAARRDDGRDLRIITQVNCGYSDVSGEAGAGPRGK